MKSILVVLSLMLSTQSFALSRIYDVNKKSPNSYEVVWGTCSPFPTLTFSSKSINEKDIIVKFETDEDTPCTIGGLDGLNTKVSHFFTIEELFNRVDINPSEDSIVYIAW